MKFERLVIESGDVQTCLDLHPQLTVITGLSDLERDGLVGEFVGSLGSARSGVHLELTADSGRRFAIFRPIGAAHRVIDVDGHSDVTAQFTDESGRIDLLTRAGLDPRAARRVMRLTSQALTEATHGDSIAAGLARVEQQELWTAAELLIASGERLEEEAAASGTTAEDVEVVERIEQRHTEFERSQEQSEGVRKVSFVVAGLSALAAIPLTQQMGTSVVMPLAALAMVAVTISLVFWRRMEAARRRETTALAEAGAQSYLGFHLQRVNSLLSSDQGRRRLLKAAEDHRSATARWTALAGDVDVQWAVTRRTDITSAARLRMDVRPLGLSHDDDSADDVAALAHALLNTLSELRDVGSTGETFPLLIDEAFSNVDPTAIPALLELLVRSSAHQQVVVLTDTENIESWARLEAITGNVGVVEVAPTVRVA